MRNGKMVVEQKCGTKSIMEAYLEKSNELGHGAWWGEGKEGNRQKHAPGRQHKAINPTSKIENWDPFGVQNEKVTSRTPVRPCALTS